jgi:WD40 repeat protein
MEVATGHSKSIRRIAIWEDITSINKPLIITASCDSSLRVFDFDGNLIRVLRGVTGRVQCFAISPDQDFNNVIAVAAGEDFEMRVWNLSTGETRFTCTGHSAEVVAISFCIGFGEVPAIVSGDRNGQVRFWDRETGQCMRVMPGSSVSL